MAFYVCGLKSNVQALTNSQPVLFCALGERKGGGVRWKRWGVVDVKEWGILLGGGGWGRDGKRRGTIPVVARQTYNYHFKPWQRENAWNVNFEILNSSWIVLSTQLIILNYPFILFHRRSTTVSLGTYPLYIFQTDLHMCSTSEVVQIYFNNKQTKETFHTYDVYRADT